MWIVLVIQTIINKITRKSWSQNNFWGKKWLSSSVPNWHIFMEDLPLNCCIYYFWFVWDGFPCQDWKPARDKQQEEGEMQLWLQIPRISYGNSRTTFFKGLLVLWKPGWGVPKRGSLLYDWSFGFQVWAQDSFSRSPPPPFLPAVWPWASQFCSKCKGRRKKHSLSSFHGLCTGPSVKDA